MPLCKSAQPDTVLKWQKAVATLDEGKENPRI